MSYTLNNFNTDTNSKYTKLTRSGLTLPKTNTSTIEGKNYKTMSNLNTEIKTFKEIVDLIPKTYLTSLKLKKSKDIFTSDSIKINCQKSQIFWEKEKILKEDSNEFIKPRKKIKEIKLQLEAKNSNFPLINRKYLDIMQESSQIIKEKKSLYASTNFEGKLYSLNKFMNENKEITIKNYLLELLKSERNNLILTEDRISKALIESDVKLEEDNTNFKKFTEDIKNKHKEMDKNYYELSKEGREYYKQKKKLMQENKQLMDDVDRTVKMIYNLKEYALFLHKVFGSNTFKFGRNSIDTNHYDFEEFAYKEKDLEKVTELLMEEFCYQKVQNKIQKIEEQPDFLEDHTIMINKFLEIEEKILKLMDSKQNLDKEYDRITQENNMINKDLEERFQKVSKEMEKLQMECEIEQKALEKLKSSSQADTTSNEIFSIIRELHHIAVTGESSDPHQNKKSKKKTVADMIKELSDNLKQMEFDVIEYINEIESISQQDEEKLKAIINKRKEFNKIQKQTDHRAKEEKENFIRKKKAEERMHRVILKGRKNVKKMIIDIRDEPQNLENKSENQINEEDNLIFYDR